MNIVVISTASLPTPPLNYGGMERVAHLLAKGLQERGHEIVMIVKQGSNPDVPFAVIYNEDEIPKVVSGLQLDAWADVFLDVSHNKVLSTVRPELPITNNYQAMSATGNPMNSVCISQGQHRVKMPNVKAEVIYQPIDIDQMAYYGGERKNYLLYMGQRITEKRIEWAMQVSIQTGIPLYTFSPGWGDASYHQMLYGLRDAYPDLIHMDGDIGGREKLEMIQHAKALIHPVGANNWCEAGAIIVLEALSCGTPCLVSDNGCLREYIFDGVNGYIMDSPEHGAQLLLDGSIDKIRPWNCRLSAEKFDYHVICAQYESLLERIVRGERW